MTDPRPIHRPLDRPGYPMPLQRAFAAWFALRDAERRGADGEEIGALKKARAEAEEGVQAWLASSRASLGTARSEHPTAPKQQKGLKVAGWAGRQLGLFGGKS